MQKPKEEERKTGIWNIRLIVFCSKKGIKLTSLKAEISRNEDIVSLYKDHKEFLDGMSAKEWHKIKDKKKSELLDMWKEEWISKELERNEENPENNMGSYVKGSIMKGNEKKSTKNNNKNVKGSNIRKNLEYLFDNKLSKGEMFLILYRKFDEYDFFEDDYEMFYKDPSQLEEKFGIMEEKNLFLIQNTQDIEQNYEEMKKNEMNIRASLDSKKKSLMEIKENLRKTLEVLDFYKGKKSSNEDFEF